MTIIDKDERIATALRACGIQADAMTVELILHITDFVRENSGNDGGITIDEILSIRKNVEEIMRPTMPGMAKPGSMMKTAPKGNA